MNTGSIPTPNIRNCSASISVIFSFAIAEPKKLKEEKSKQKHPKFQTFAGPLLSKDHLPQNGLFTQTLRQSGQELIQPLHGSLQVSDMANSPKLSRSIGPS
jgi:hypothetical protein